jgi:hypothetical protein
VNFKTTGVLLVLALIGGTVWFVSRDGAPSEFDEPASASTEKPFVIEPQPSGDDVVRIAAVNQHGDSMAFEREPAGESEGDAAAGSAGWRVVEPIETAAERWVVQGLATTFFGLKSQRSFAPGAGGAAESATGLDKPRAVFTLTTKDDKTYTFTVGAGVAVSNDTYVQVQSGDGAETVHVVPRDLSLEVGRKLKDYRGKSLFPRDRAEPVALQIDYQGTHYSLTRSADEQWIFDAPIKSYADNNKVSGLVNRCTSMYVREFIDDAPASLERYGLAQPELVVRIKGAPDEEGAQAEYAVEVGAFSDLEKQNRYIKLVGQPWVASVAQTSIDPLVPKLSELRDSRVARIESGAAEKIVLTRGETVVTLVKDKGEWTGDGDLATVELQAVGDLLAALEDVRAIDYVDQPGDLSEYGLDAPRMTISVTSSGAVDPVTVAVGANTASDRNAYAQVAGQSSVLVVSSAQADRLAIDPTSLRSRKIFALRTADITAIESTVVGHKRVLEKGNDWKMTEPAEAPIDAGALRDLLNDVALLRAASVVGQGAFGKYRLDDPDTMLEFTVAEAADEAGGETAGRHSLRLSTVEDKTYCRKDDEPYVFELDATVVPTLTGELIERKLLDVDASAVKRVALVSGEDQVAFERSDNGWTYSSDPYVKVTGARVDQLVATAAGLRVRQYLAYAGGDVSSDDLAAPQFEIELGLDGDRAITLRLSHVDAGDGTRSGAWLQQQRVFVLPSGGADELNASLDWYLGEDAPVQGPQ